MVATKRHPYLGRMFLTVPLCRLASNQWFAAVSWKLNNRQTDREITKTHKFYFTQNMRNMLPEEQIISPETSAPKIQIPSKTKNIDLKRPAADLTLKFMSFLKLFFVTVGLLLCVAKIGDVEITEWSEKSLVI